MAAKVIFALCATAIVQSAYSQCIGRGIAAPCGAIAPVRSYGCGYAPEIAAASYLDAAWGGCLDVASISAVPPTGLNVVSENLYEGPLAVAGNMPFLGTVAMEGVFPTVGAGAVSYNCGNGAIGITAEGVDTLDGIGLGGLGYNGLGYNGIGYNSLGYNSLGYRGNVDRIDGCGCGALY